jgi:multidrug efflux pump subunit AcrA (membrane-fusion protein)
MDLVRKAREGEEVVITEALAKRLQSPDESVIASTRTTRPVYSRKPLEVGVQGVVAYDTRFVQTIAARMGGRVEKVYLRYPYQVVRKGQPVAELYSPEMLAAQRELLFLMKTDSANSTLIGASRQKLMLLGATPSQIDAWVKSGDVEPRITVFSPVDGYVIVQGSSMPTVSATPAAGADMGEGMTATPAATPATPVSSEGPGLVRAGDYVARGQLLFTIASHESVRIELNVPVHQAGALHVGDRLSMELNGGGKREATVDFVQPFYEEDEVLQKIRAYVQDRSLRIGQLVQARLFTESSETLWVPRNAVADLGKDQVVFVKDRGVFKARLVQTGLRTDGWYEIKNGLASAEEIAEEAAFLVDSESFIKTDRNK